MAKEDAFSPSLMQAYGVKRTVLHESIDAKLDAMQFTDVIDNRYGSITFQLRFEDGIAKLVATERTMDMVVDIVKL